MARLNLKHQSEIENKALEIRTRYENNLAEMKLSIKRQFDEEFEQEIKKLKGDKSKVEDENKGMYEEKLKAEKDYKIILEDKSRLEVLISAIKADFSNQVKKMNEKEAKIKEEYEKMNEYKLVMNQEKKEYEKCIAAQEIKENNLKIKFDEFNDKFSNLSESLAQKDSDLETNSVRAKELNDKLEKELKAENEKLKKELTEELATESENRATFESEVLFLKQKIQKMELEEQEISNQALVEKDEYSENQSAYEEHIAQQTGQIQELSNELNTYKEMESKLTDRVKWAFKKRE